MLKRPWNVLSERLSNQQWNTLQPFVFLLVHRLNFYKIFPPPINIQKFRKKTSVVLSQYCQMRRILPLVVIKRTVALVWVWLKVVWLERAKIDEEPLMAFIFLLCLPFISKFNKTAVLWENKQKMPEICGDTAGVRPRGFPCFLLAGDLEGNVLIGCPLLFGHFPQSVSTTLFFLTKQVSFISKYSAIYNV